MPDGRDDDGDEAFLLWPRTRFSNADSCRGAVGREEEEDDDEEEEKG